MSPKKMKGMLKNMGINIDELENVSEVVIRLPDREIVISNPSVAIMDSHGTRSYQISGEESERAHSSASKVQAAEAPVEILDSDVQLVASQTGAGLGQARAALQESKGDLAAAIIKLSSK